MSAGAIVLAPHSLKGKQMKEKEEAKGYDKAFKEGHIVGYEKAVEEGYQEGLKKGFIKGMKNAISDENHEVVNEYVNPISVNIGYEKAINHMLKYKAIFDEDNDTGPYNKPSLKEVLDLEEKLGIKFDEF